ncbi:lipid A-modifier LpxR family protein [Mesobacterium sp. TK19101]|uniref:Lipid A-modifier LpxR family protein n=1 Tax=Mesobacterium hydrothermale TaxID=3111907 RepID=A0ABU6HEB0_9RHOB|nr:lipid A-modifier LpxR family protein [Mesobacterium sp. TK19101]MEC3860804.1 lipid A-modifier LpxR family protein [Mesobacterium sp. TK19101]
MYRWIAVVFALAVWLGAPVLAGERVKLGYGRLISNDSLLASRDRWQTGSMQSSRIRGLSWSGAVPQALGELLEYRFEAALVSPQSIRWQRPTDRPFAGALSIGLHTHFQRRGIEYALGGDVVFTGPQTGLTDFQTFWHDALGLATPKPSVTAQQVGDGIYPTAVFEIGQTYRTGKLAMRPFAELRAGAETLVRSGVDVTFGTVGQSELLVRDRITGQRYRTVWNDLRGVSLTAGADLAHVTHSVFLPESPGYDIEETRGRVRAGVHWQGRKLSAFYGWTWLSKEFSTQPEGQLVKSIRIKYDF